MDSFPCEAWVAGGIPYVIVRGFGTGLRLLVGSSLKGSEFVPGISVKASCFKSLIVSSNLMVMFFS